jgi:glycosyltransferase involved in cell wall biosynthesis
MPRRVLFIAAMPFFQWRGSPIRVRFDVEALAELGYEVDLLTLPVGEDRKVPGVRVLRAANPFGVTEVPIGPSGRKAFFNLLLLFEALRLASSRRYAVIHAVEEAGVFAWLLARMTGAKAIFEKHSDPASYREGLLRNLVMSAYGQAEKMSIRGAHAVIATGEALCEQVRGVSSRKPVHHIFDIPSSRVEPDPERAAEIRAGLLEHPLERLVLYVGSFAVYQGIDLMFESMPHVLERHPQTRFVIIGGSAAEIEQRRAWLRARGIERSVSFLGTVPPDELPSYLAAADVLLSPRIAGVNTPLKLLDYLKVGRAIVATDNPANRRILDESIAVLAEPRPLEFAEAISRWIADEGGRARMGERGRRRVEERYHFREFRRRLGACYDEVLGGPSPRAAPRDHGVIG